MAGRPKEDPTKTQQQEIAEKKAEFLKFYAKTGVKQAACDWIGRHKDSVAVWEEQDAEFSRAVSKAKAEFLATNQRRIKPDNLIANLYDEYKPPKQQIDHTLTGNVTINILQPHDQLPADPEAIPGVAVPDRSDDD